MSEEQNNKKGKNMHRRNKDEISRQFRCTYPKCQKSYGAESSLKTHVRFKHPQHIIQNCQKKPILRAGRPCVKPKTQQDNLDTSDCWNDYGYVTFLHTIMGMQPCDWVRAGEDQFCNLKVQQFVQNIQSQNQHFEIPQRLINYFQNGKKIFRSEVIQQLYSKIIYGLNGEVTKKQLQSQIKLSPNDLKQRKQQQKRWVSQISKILQM